MRCGIRDLPSFGGGCSSPGIFNDGCIYEVGWESLALADGGTDATLKYLPRSGKQRVVGFICDVIQPVQAATGPGAGPLEGQAAYLSALTVNGNNYMPDLASGVGAALSSKYALSAFARAISQRAGGPLAEIDKGNGTPWAQFGVHRIKLGIEDDVTCTVQNETGLAADLGGTFQVLQLAGPGSSDDAVSGGQPRVTSNPSSAYNPVP